MAGAAVVGVVVAGTLLAVVVPWDWVPAVPEGAGAVCAEAGRAFSTRKRPARSAKAATHLRGRTSSFLRLLLIGLTDRLGEAASAAAVGRCRDGRS